MYCTVLYCTVLYCTVLYCTLGSGAVLYCDWVRIDSPIGGGSTQELFVVGITTIKCAHLGGKQINFHIFNWIFSQKVQKLDGVGPVDNRPSTD